MKISYISIDSYLSHNPLTGVRATDNEYLILPLKFCPHLPELNLGTRCRHNVVHDVNVYVAQHHTVSVGSATDYVVNCERRVWLSVTCTPPCSCSSPIFPNIIPFSVEDTLMFAYIETKIDDTMAVLRT